MKKLQNLFTKHPHSVGETYLQHMFNAISFSFRLEGLSFVAFVHSIFPFLFEKRTGDSVKKLNDELQGRQKKLSNYEKLEKRIDVLEKICGSNGSKRELIKEANKE